MRDLKEWALSALLIGVLAVAVSYLQGCAGVRDRLDRNDAMLQLAVQASTARVLHEHPTWRAEVVRISSGGLELLEDETTTLGVLEYYVLEEIPWDKMLPEEQALARVALRAIKDETLRHLAEQGIRDPAGVRVRVATVLRWVLEVAEA